MPRSVLIKLQNCQPNTKLCTTVKKLEQKSRATGVSDFFSDERLNVLWLKIKISHQISWDVVMFYMTSSLNVLLNKISSEEQNVQKEGPCSFGIILFGLHFLGTYRFNTGTYK